MFKNNRYSIRKFSVGTGSVIIGAMLYLSTPNIVNAEESNVLKEESQSTESTTNADSNKNIETSNETNETNTKEESTQDLNQQTSTENPTTENDTAESNTSEENAKEDKEEQSDFTIDSINDQTVKSNEAINPIKINVEGSENNTNQVQGLPDGLTYDSSTDTITGTPTAAGNYTITVISKNDSGVQKETTFTINVEEAEEPSTEEPQTNEDSKSTEENTTEEPTSDEQKSDENSTNEDSKEDNKDTTEEPKSSEEDSSEEPSTEEPSKDNNKSTEDSKNDDEDKSKDFSSEEPTNDKDSKTDQSKTDDKNSTKDKKKSDENSTNIDPDVDKKDTTEEPKSTEEDTLEEPSTEEPLNNSSEHPDTANNDLSTSDSENDNNIDPNVDATDLKTTKPLTDKEKEDINQKSKNKSKTDKNLKALSASSSKVEKEATKADGSPLGGDDVNSKIKSSNVKFQDGTWKKGAAFEIGFDISIPNDVKRNDYFTVHIPKEINPTSADRDNGILLGNDANSIYAKGTYNRSDNSFTFKFTDNVEKYKNNSAHVDFLGLINFKEATKTDNYNLNLKIGDSEYNATRKIEYSTDARNLDLYQDSSIQEKVDDHNPYNTTYTVNGKARTLNNAKVKITPYNGTKKNPDVISQFNKDITKVQILKVTDRNTLNQSGSAKDVAYVDVSSSHNIIFNSDGTISIDLGNTNSTYLIVVNSETSKPFVPETFIEGTIQLSASNAATGSSQSKIGKSKPSSNNSSGVIVDDTTPPVVDKVDNKTTEVNSAIDPIVINANDNSGETVRNDVYGLPDGVTYNSETNTISGTPTKAGTYEVTVISSDKVYNETETTFTITVEDTTAPTVDPIEDQTTEVNTPITDVTLNGKDNSGDPVTNNVTGLPDGVTYNEETNTISGTPTKAGNYNVTVITSDEAGNETETTFTITVEDKTAPTVDPVDNQTTEVNTPITDIKLTGEDNSGDPVTHNVTGLPDGVTYNEATQTISGTPTTPGNYEITIVTRDEAGNSVETTFTITVEDTLPPTVDPVADQTTEVNTPIEDITLNGKDNSGQPVTHEVSGLPDGVTYNPETNTISGTPTSVGSYDVTVISTDETGNTTETTFTITVEDTIPPTVDPIDNQTTEVNTPITNITLSGEDNSGQPVSHIVSGLPEGVVYDEVSKTISGTPTKTGDYNITVVTRDEAGNETETNTISGTPTTVGSYDVTVVSTDESGNTTETTFTITVEDTTAPDVDPVDDQTTEVNTPIEDVTLNSKDNSGQPVTHEVSGLPEGVTYDSETNTISGTPTTVGSYEVTVVTTDESGNKTETTFTITVEDTTAPDVDPVDDQTTEVNTPIEDVTLNSKDNSGQPVTHEVSGLPEGVTYDSETNTISGTPTTVGSYDVTVVTTDESGNTTETTFTITVEDTTAPTVDPVEDQTTEVKTPIEDITLNGQDNSGKPVTHEVSGLPDGVTFNPETNTISGTPTTVGSYDVKVVTTDESGNTTETTFTITVEDTTSPDVDPVDDQTTEVNTPIKDVTLNGKDNSGQPVTHEVIGLPEGVTYDSETNTISGTPTTVGSYDVTVVSTDESGNKTETTFTITVEDTTAPDVDPVDDQTTEVNTPIKDVALSGEDNSGQPVTHEVSGLPEGVTFNPETNTISGTPTTVGSYEVTVVTTDESGNTTETTFTITVEDTLPPTVDPVEDQTTEVNTPIKDITLNGKDNSGKPVTHEVSGLPEGVTYDSETNTISGTPTTVGSYDVTVVTTDESGNTTETTFTITVEDTTAPDVDPVDDQTTEVNTPIEDISLNGKDNSGQPVTHEVSGLPEGVTYDSETNTISGTPTTVGSYDVTVVSTDESGNKTETTFTITVEDTKAPVVDPVEDQTTEVNTPIKDVTLNGKDNSGKPVSHEVSGLPEGVSFDPETNTISGTPTTVGTYDVTVVSTDESGNKTETTFTITVEDTTAPDVDPVDDQTTEVNTPIGDVTLNSKDNSGQPVTHEVSGLPEGVTYDSETNTISGTPTTVGSYDVTVVSTDESGNKTETTFTITVEDTKAPTVDPIEDQTTEVNTPIKDVTLNSKDNSGQPVTHEVSGLPEGVTYDPETNTISGTPTTVGSYDVTVVSTDESGNKTETTFTITVQDTTAPDVDPVDDQTTEVNTPITSIELNGQDNSGQPVTHEVSGLPEGVTYDPETNTISGTPTTVGSYEVTVVTTDESGNKTETTFTITVEDTTAPTLDPIEDQTTEVNTPIKDITLNGKDNSGKSVTHEVSGLPEGVTYNPETNTISGTPTNPGEYTVTVVTRDSEGNETTTTFVIIVKDDSSNDGNNPGDNDGDDNSGDNGDDSSNGGNDNSGDNGDDSSNDGNNNSGDNGDDSSNDGNDNSGDNGSNSSNGGNDNSGDNGSNSSNDGNDNSGDNGSNSSNDGNDNSGDNGDYSSNDGNDSKELPDTGEQDKNLTLFASVIALFGGILTFRRKKKDSKTEK